MAEIIRSKTTAETLSRTDTYIYVIPTTEHYIVSLVANYSSTSSFTMSVLRNGVSIATITTLATLTRSHLETKFNAITGDVINIVLSTAALNDIINNNNLKVSCTILAGKV